jgi:hypothetical protein
MCLLVFKTGNPQRSSEHRTLIASPDINNEYTSVFVPSDFGLTTQYILCCKDLAFWNEIV